MGDGAPGPRARLAGPGVEGLVALSQGAVAAGEARRIYAEVRVTAAPSEPSGSRPPVALVVVLDTSGSMSGGKIEEARRATITLADQMQSSDHLAVVAYNGGAWVPVPMGPVGDRRQWIHSAVGALRAGGSTNIPGAITLATMTLEGAPEGHVQRMVLVSDGIDGSRVPLPSVASRVRQAAGDGLTVSALGVGVDYDERFLTTVADAGRGNYEFLASAAALDGFLGRELDQASTTTMSEVATVLAMPPGGRVVGVHGADLVPSGRSTFAVSFGALAGGDARQAFVEIELPPSADGTALNVAPSLTYRTVVDGERHTVTGEALPIRIVESAALAATTRDRDVHLAALAIGADARQAAAIDAWRAGRTEEALRISAGNQAVLRQVQQLRPSADVAARLEEFRQDDANFRAPQVEDWVQSRGLEANAARRGRLWQRR